MMKHFIHTLSEFLFALKVHIKSDLMRYDLLSHISLSYF